MLNETRHLRARSCALLAAQEKKTVSVSPVREFVRSLLLGHYTTA
jgi:hypothetical protein